MSDENVTTWKCDRCGATERCPGRDQPAHWKRLRACKPPLSTPDEATVVGDLCLGCSADLHDRFMQNKALDGRRPRV